MSKRIITLTLSFLILFTSVTSSASVGASTRDSLLPVNAPLKADAERVIQEAGKSAVYDSTGRIIGLTLIVAGNKKLNFDVKYDEQNRLLAVIDQTGAQTRYEYDKAGQLQGLLLLPSGERLTYLRDQNGSVTGVKRTVPIVGTKKTSQYGSKGASETRYLRASAMVLGCDEAVERATLAVLAIPLACSVGPLACGTAVAAAAYLTYRARQECGGDRYALEEQAF